LARFAVIGLAPALVCTHSDAADTSQGAVVHVAYFVPRDRKPIPGYVDRLGRVMGEVQRFYRDGNAGDWGVWLSPELAR
jgi:hypothetical protein